MTPLSEVAADVAAALGLVICGDGTYHNVVNESPTGHIIAGPHRLNMDGSNLTDPYWRCACEDWLNDKGYVVELGQSYAEAEEFDGLTVVQIKTPLAEAPARLVSAVWRKMHATPRT